MWNGWRKLWMNGAVGGTAITLLIAAADRARLFLPLEQWLYDRRAASCQFFAPPPTDKLVHLDIDDATLEAVGAWPWPRATLAAITDEIRRAGPKVVAFDVLFSEPQKLEYRPAADLDPHLPAPLPEGEGAGGRGEGSKAAPSFTVIDNDALFAGALHRLNRGLLPLSLRLGTSVPPSPIRAAVENILSADPALTSEQVADALRRRGLGSADLPDAVEAEWLPARRQAVAARVRAELVTGPLTREQVRRRLGLQDDPNVRSHSAVERLVDEQYDAALAEAALARWAAPVPANFPEVLPAAVNLAPIPELASAVSATGFVDYPRSSDGVVRHVPLLLEHRGRLYPQIGLSLACQFLDADLSRLRYGAGSIIIPLNGGRELSLPVCSAYSETLKRDVPMTFDIPWIGTADWESMYDPAHPRARKNHVSLASVWDVCRTEEKIADNNATAKEALLKVTEFADAAAAKKLADAPPDLRDADAWAAIIRPNLDYLNQVIQQYAAAGPLTDEDKRLARNCDDARRALRAVLAENANLSAQLAAGREKLSRLLQGRAALAGWIATSSVADIVPTSIHPRCPGVAIHGTIFNGIVTGRLWRRSPQWVTPLLTIALGLLTTALVAKWPPLRAAGAALALGLLYLLFNGVVLFDRFNQIAGLAGPLAAVVLVWACGTLLRLVAEGIQRAHITRRFRSYVDPTLVNYVLAHPRNARLEGQKREMTVGFTDLKGFTTLSESLGEQTVPLLNEFMGLAVPIIRANGGYVNKFLGDGIMFFYGAPQEDPGHAAHAVASVLHLHAALVEMNSGLLKRGLPLLGLRAGISTGTMVVGDAGSIDASDYTVLGDAVNLGSRLESANKVTGTATLVSARTVELCGGEFLFRPVGKLRVVGKQQGVMTYEAMAEASRATDEQKQRAAGTAPIIEAFLAGNFHACLQAVQRLEELCGPGPLTILYRDRCEKLLDVPPLDGFDGCIELSEK